MSKKLYGNSNHINKRWSSLEYIVIRRASNSDKNLHFAVHKREKEREGGEEEKLNGEGTEKSVRREE